MHHIYNVKCCEVKHNHRLICCVHMFHFNYSQEKAFLFLIQIICSIFSGSLKQLEHVTLKSKYQDNFETLKPSTLILFQYKFHHVFLGQINKSFRT